MRQVFCKVKHSALDRLLNFPCWVIHSEHSFPRQVTLILCRNSHARGSHAQIGRVMELNLGGGATNLYYIAYRGLFR